MHHASNNWVNILIEINTLNEERIRDCPNSKQANQNKQKLLIRYRGFHTTHGNEHLKRIRQICIGKLVERIKFDFKI